MQAPLRRRPIAARATAATAAASVSLLLLQPLLVGAPSPTIAPLNASTFRRVIRGVPPSRQPLMVAAASPVGPPLECVPYGSPAGATAVPVVPDALNDDYCDCADGSDEPGTSACAGAVTHRSFWCTAVTGAGDDDDDPGDGGRGGGTRGDASSVTGAGSGLAPGAVASEGGQLLYPSAVRDGVCDCCDGSDEAPGVCGSTCGAAAEVAAAVADEAAAVVETGLADRASLVASASEVAARDTAALAAARLAVAAAKRRVTAATTRMEQTVAWKDAVRAAAEAAVTPTAAAVTPEVAPPPTGGVQPGGSLDESLVAEPAVAGAGEAGAVLEGDAATAAVIRSEEDEDMGRPPPPDPDLPPEDPDAMPDWEDSDRGALDADEVPHSAAGGEGVGGGEGEGVNPPPFPPGDCGGGNSGASAAMLLRRATAAAGAASTWVSNTTRGRASLRLLVGALSRLSPLPTPSAAAAAAADKCVTDAQAESSAARSALDDAERTLSTAQSAASPGSKDADGNDGAASSEASAELKTKVAAASGTSADPFGPNGVYRALRGRCIRRKKSQYEFELCILERAAQFEGRRRIASLGNFVRWDDTDGSMLYEGGDSCWNGPRRSVRVAVTCGAGESEIVDVDEPSVCVYAMTLRTPAACVPSEANRLRRKAAALRSAAMAAQQWATKDEL